MLTVALDTNIIVDFFHGRQPSFGDAAEIIHMAEAGELNVVLCATSITTLFYLSAKAQTPKVASKQIGEILKIVEVAAVSRAALAEALSSRMADFEDAVLAFAARGAGAELIVTRNPKDFKHSPIAPILPTEFLLSRSVAP